MVMIETRDSRGNLIVLETGDGTVDRVSALREGLEKAAAQERTLSIDLSALATIDLSVIQLLEAFFIHCEKNGITLSVVSWLQPECDTILGTGGFTVDLPITKAAWLPCHYWKSKGENK